MHTPSPQHTSLCLALFFLFVFVLSHILGLGIIGRLVLGLLILDMAARRTFQQLHGLGWDMGRPIVCLGPRQRQYREPSRRRNPFLNGKDPRFEKGMIRMLSSDCIDIPSGEKGTQQASHQDSSFVSMLPDTRTKSRAGPNEVSSTHKTMRASHDNAQSHSLRSSISYVDQFPSLFPTEGSGERVAWSRGRVMGGDGTADGQVDVGQVWDET